MAIEKKNLGVNSFKSSPSLVPFQTPYLFLLSFRLSSFVSSLYLQLLSSYPTSPIPNSLLQCGKNLESSDDSKMSFSRNFCVNIHFPYDRCLKALLNAFKQPS